MAQVLFDVDAGDFANALVLLSLDELAGLEPNLNAPVLAAADRSSLRDWIAQSPGLGEFPFNVDMSGFLALLEKRVPAKEMAALIRWATISSGLCDPAAERTNWPQHPMNAWMMALRTAQQEDTIGYLDLPKNVLARLGKLITAHGKAIKAGEAFSHQYVKSWDPHDPQLIAYNSKFKTAWDLKVYQEYCIPRSVILEFALGQIIKNQADRAFIMAYAQSFDSTTHSVVRKDLPQAVEGAGLYAVHPWQLETLQKHGTHAPETLFPLAAAGMDL